ncbi:MAG: radical SAM protein [Nitrospira sp.]|nr:radical SAM protein [Nitrospira sp.]
MQQYNFNNHKLIYHSDRVNEFIKEGGCYPLYMEISPIGICNHRCIFCAYDYIEYPDRRLETTRLLNLIDEMSACGLKSLLFAGEGEPLLHPDIDKFINKSREKNIDTGIFTNGQKLHKELAEKILPGLSFIRFSFNGGTSEVYSHIHNTGLKVFDRVVQNIRAAVQVRKRHKLPVDIGAQYVLLPENMNAVFDAAQVMRDSGIDYFVIKPFMQRQFQSYIMKEEIDRNAVSGLFSKLERLSSESFNVIIRKEFLSDNGHRNYTHCYGTSFITVLNSAGDVSSCLPYWDREDFSFGNIYEKSFSEIWHGDKRKKITEYLEKDIPVQKCPPLCRQNDINQFLWEIKHPTVRHINFI